MPMKRVIDYPRIYDSAKLGALPSDELRTEYLWLLGIAGPNGSFEWSERRLWATAYAGVRDKTQAEVAGYLQSFLDAGLLVKWEQDGKTWGYFVGSDKPARLPRDSWKKRFAKTRQLEPPPPPELLRGSCTAVARDADEVSTTEVRRDGEKGALLSLSLPLSSSLKEKEIPPAPLRFRKNQTTLVQHQQKNQKLSL